MSHKIAYIVGDKFKNYAIYDDVYTFSQFVDVIYLKSKDFSSHNIVMGQGLSIEEKKMLIIIAAQFGVNDLTNMEEMIVDKEITHKHKIENVMVTSPIKEANDNSTYMSDLILNDDCSEMSDHMTGQHIQGMVLTEAARQMMLAVAEKYFLKSHEKGNSYCALVRINSEFHQFVFPVDIKVLHKVHYFERKGEGFYKASTKTDFMQNGKITTSIGIDYILDHKGYLGKMEHHLGAIALKENLEIKGRISV